MNNLGSELGIFFSTTWVLSREGVYPVPTLSWTRVIASIAKQSPRIALAILGQHLRVEIATGSLRTLAMTVWPDRGDLKLA
ncbi:MAG: hypothetical protein HYW47_04555 [Deltaproteobacteria bacterium]|nr:hypothetical protein [Deltaproteobacteria bacterium]